LYEVIYDEIEEFAENKKSSSVRTYLYKYFELVGKSPKEYFSGNPDIDKDTLMYANSIKDLAPGTKKGVYSTLKTFFKFNNLRLQPRTEYKLKELQKGSSSVCNEIVPDQQILKEILSNGGALHRALFLTMASSGLRPGEVIMLKLDDVHLNENPARINVRPLVATKKHQKYTTFMSSEAKYYVELWLKKRVYGFENFL
jgi:integrase